MCREGRAERAGQNERIFAGDTLDAYLVREDVGQRGYAIAIWRGRHVADPTELSDDEAAAYFCEVLVVSRALERRYHPAKLNLAMLGNTVPHLHTHIVPRYVDDDRPGVPPAFLNDRSQRPALPAHEYERDARALRADLRRSTEG